MKRFALLLFIGLCLLILPAGTPAADSRLPRREPAAAGLDPQHLEAIDQVVADGLAAGEMPGCVVLLVRRGAVVWLRAYGDRQTEPERTAMTVDTVFDLASLTKPIATATSVMLLLDEGRLGLQDPVAKYLPEFGQNGKDQITIYQLLTHQAGLTPDNALADYEQGVDKAWERIHALGLRAEPGARFLYTDVGYMVLAEVVRRAAGQGVHEFSQQRIFQPLGMQQTGYLPDEALRRRAAPTEQRAGRWMQGEVHDPRAYLLGGIAGHAGLFSTAEDLAVYAQMLLGGGCSADTRILSAAAVRRMTAGYPVPGGLRGLGWDVRTGYSSNRGDGFSSSAYGHGGFTGTALWIDPDRDLAVVFLSNRLHPDGKGSVNRLAGRIGSIATEAIVDPPPAGVLTGIDVLRRDSFRQLAGRRVGLITNQTGISRDGTRTIDLLRNAEGLQLVALFSPEHGLEGRLDQSRIADGHEQQTGLPVFSLYGQTRKPTAESLRGIDTLVFDIQDIGARFYTYISTLGLAMEAAAENGLRLVVLDRPNPIGGVEVAGPLLDAGRESFVGYHRIPVQHGLTVGELARLFRAERQLDVDLQVIPLEGWRREQRFDETGLPWVNPSPNMRSPREALLYPGIGLLETTNLSVGRGTEIPFEVIGAPWLDGAQLAERLNSLDLPGVDFVPITFVPSASQFEGQRCGGVRILVTDEDAYRSVHTGLQIAVQLRALYPDAWQAAGYDRLLGNQAALDALLGGKQAAEIEAAAEPELAAFRERRREFLLYGDGPNAQRIPAGRH